MKYTQKTFSVPVATSQKAKDNWERTFPVRERPATPKAPPKPPTVKK